MLLVFSSSSGNLVHMIGLRSCLHRAGRAPMDDGPRPWADPATTWLATASCRKGRWVPVFHRIMATASLHSARSLQPMHAGAALASPPMGCTRPVRARTSGGSRSSPGPNRHANESGSSTRLSFFVAGQREILERTGRGPARGEDSSVVRWRCGRGREERTVRPVTRRRPVASALVPVHYPPGASTWTCTLVARGRRPPGSIFSGLRMGMGRVGTLVARGGRPPGSIFSGLRMGMGRVGTLVARGRRPPGSIFLGLRMGMGRVGTLVARGRRPPGSIFSGLRMGMGRVGLLGH
jgi:hypothetical protein